jgi:diguanylate cyclase (GGDEF)-like protein
MEDSHNRPASVIMEFLSRRSKLFVVLAGFFLIVLLGVADYLSGTRIRFFIFYWPPIAMVAWFAGRRLGYGLAIFAGLTWLAANWTDDLIFDDTSVTVFNLAVNWASFVLLGYVVSRLRDYVDVEQAVARTDFLTQTANSRAFLEALSAQVARSQRSGEPFSVASLDVDNFKEVNDRFGHEGGNELLKAIAATLRQDLRGADLVARMGGDEFAMLLPRTGPEHARAVVGRVQSDLKAAVAQGRWPVSFSIGVVTSITDPAPPEALLELADQLMYEVKRRGKDGVKYLTVHEPEPGAPVRREPRDS